MQSIAGTPTISSVGTEGVPLAEAAAGSSFPEPRIPKNPVLGWASFVADDEASGERAPPNVLEMPHKRFVTSARVAIALALARLGVGPGDRVLVPAYHSLSMIEPIVSRGAEPVFFPLTPGLDVSPDAIGSMDLARVRALLVTHYFGFPQPMAAIRAFADAHGIPIIEDCAHAVFGCVDGRPIGSWGDYAAISLMKFFPVYDGGCLASAFRALDDLVLHRPSRRFEAKAFLNTIERGLAYGRFPGLQLAARTVLGAKDAAWSAVKHVRVGHGGTVAYQGPAASEGVNGLDPVWLDRRISAVSGQLVSKLPLARIVGRRRRHYQRLAVELADLPGARPFFGHLPDTIVPYVFPLWVDQPARVFSRLKTDGVPLFRWERLWSDEAVRVDPLSSRYATEIFQLPCHQELTDDDVSWVIDRVKSAFAVAAVRAAE